jgi:hypothetical protein
MPALLTLALVNDLPGGDVDAHLGDGGGGGEAATACRSLGPCRAEMNGPPPGPWNDQREAALHSS